METFLVLKELGFIKTAVGDSDRYIRTKTDLTDVVSSRLALEGSRIPKNVNDAKTYNTIKDVPYVGNQAKKLAISKSKVKYAPVFKSVLKDVKDDTATVSTIADKTLSKLLLPTDSLKKIHTADSLNYVQSGKVYPKELDTHYDKVKQTPAYKKLLKGQ